MKKKLISILICIFICKLGWSSEIDPISTKEAIPKAEIIIEANLDSQKSDFVEKLDNQYIDRKVIYYSISDIKVIKGSGDFYSNRTFYYMAPYPEFIRDADGKKVRIGISGRIDGTGREFILENNNRYVFFAEQLSQKKLKVIRVEESSPEKLKEINMIIGYTHGPGEVETSKAVHLAEKFMETQPDAKKYSPKATSVFQEEAGAYIVRFKLLDDSSKNAALVNVVISDKGCKRIKVK